MFNFMPTIYSEEGLNANLREQFDQGVRNVQSIWAMMHMANHGKGLGLQNNGVLNSIACAIEIVLDKEY